MRAVSPVATLLEKGEKFQCWPVVGGQIFETQDIEGALSRHGISRQDAYRMVQRHALATWDEGGHLYDRLADDAEIQRVLKPDELSDCFNLDRHLQHVDRIFERVLEAS